MFDFFYLKDRNNFVQVNFSDILYIEAKNKYCNIITAGQKYVTHLPINAIERSLPSRYFCRIHRAYIISLVHTKSFNQLQAIVAGRKLPIGKHYRCLLPARVFSFTTDPRSYILLSDYDLFNLLRRIEPN